MLLVTTERAFWRYDNTFLFTNQSEVDFGIARLLNDTVSGRQIKVNVEHCWNDSGLDRGRVQIWYRALVMT